MIFYLRDRYQPFGYHLYNLLTQEQKQTITVQEGEKIYLEDVKVFFQLTGEYGEGEKKCLCGVKINHLAYIMNIATKKTYLIGSKCVERFDGEKYKEFMRLGKKYCPLCLTHRVREEDDYHKQCENKTFTRFRLKYFPNLNYENDEDVSACIDRLEKLPEGKNMLKVISILVDYYDFKFAYLLE